MGMPEGMKLVAQAAERKRARELWPDDADLTPQDDQDRSRRNHPSGRKRTRAGK